MRRIKERAIEAFVMTAAVCLAIAGVALASAVIARIIFGG